MYRDFIAKIGSDEDAEDLVQGQFVIVAARWILVAAGLVLAVIAPEALGPLRIQIVLILGLAVANFYLHSQLLMKRPVVRPIAYAASVADIAAI